MMSSNSSNYKVLLNTIDYIGNNEDNRTIYPRKELFELEKFKKTKKKRHVAISLLMVLTTITTIISIYFCASGSFNNNEESLQKTIVDSIENILQHSNCTIDDKFLKRLDKFLFKRRGWLSVTYNVDYIAWIIATCTNSTIWFVTTFIFCKKWFFSK
jgi:hypothetical protein